MFKTHGGENKGKAFSCLLENDNLILKRIDEQLTTKTLTFGIREIMEILSWLHGKFGTDWFALGSKVDALDTDDGKSGLAIAILQVYPGDKLHAAGALYLGVILEKAGIFEWNQKNRGIQWRIVKEIHKPNELKSLIQALINGNLSHH